MHIEAILSMTTKSNKTAKPYLIYLESQLYTCDQEVDDEASSTFQQLELIGTAHYPVGIKERSGESLSERSSVLQHSKRKIV